MNKGAMIVKMNDEALKRFKQKRRRQADRGVPGDNCTTRIGVFAVLVFLIVTMLIGLLSSCNVTRTVTTTAQHIQKGDTTTTIMTKTIESYDGKVDATKLLQK